MVKKMKKKLNFDVCTFCNHKCSFCSNSDDRTIKYQTSLDEFQKVMSNVLQYVECDELGLSAKGEVLVNSDFTKIVRSCKEDFQIPYIYISSNGALLDEKKAIEIIDAGMDSIKFSINAVTRESYKEVHKVDDFEKVIKNYKDLINLKRQKYPKLKIFLSSVIDMSKEELESSFKALLGAEDYALIDGVSLYALTYTPKFEVHSDAQVTSKCSIPFRELYINSDGTLGLCCKDYFDEVNFGSLLEHNFMDVYNSDTFKEVREMHKKSEFPDGHLCKNCLLYDGGI
jgi:MoaA/NifB/PqqE/SkfB family radical SAM enzyme